MCELQIRAAQSLMPSAPVMTISVQHVAQVPLFGQQLHKFLLTEELTEEETSCDGAGEVEVNMCSSCPISETFSVLFADGVCSTGRYLLCEVNVSDRSSLLLLDDRAIAATVRAAVARIHGDYGAALCSRFSGEQ